MIKSILVSYRPEPNLFSELALTALRVGVGLSLALAHGMGKIPPPEMFAAGLAGMGFPLPGLFAWLASLAEFGGGLILAVGLLTRPASFFVAVTMGVAFFMAHAQDPFAKKELAFLYGIVAVFYMIRGSGKFSVDSLLK